jgi:ComF family protein
MCLHLPGSLRSFFASITDLIYPPLCLSCQRLLERGGEFLCPDCWNAIQNATEESPLFIETADKLAASGVINGLVSLYVFEKEGAFQVIVHNLKYSGVQALGVELGRRLGKVVIERGICVDAIIPVPLHRKKLRERGYNQAELIARGLSEVSGIPVRCDLIRRKKYTKTQTQLSLTERRANMENAFEVVPIRRCETQDKKFIVIDDVVTTGSTMIACASVLRASGAIGVIGASAALAE